MNLHKKRLVRTSESEQYALFDLDRTDANLDPVSIGKLDLHFTADGSYGTLLLWKETMEPLDQRRRELLIDSVLLELGTTMGVSPDYALEVFVPELSGYELFSNMRDEEDTEDEDEDMEGDSDVDED